MSHSARVWNYWLGGKDNYQVDRVTGDRVAEMYPDIVLLARAARGFLSRAVGYLAGEGGIRQFLDIGTGLPTASNTHEIAQSIAPESRVVYVDNDPIVLSHARALLCSSPQGATDYIDADARDVGTVLEEAARTLDFSRPVAVIFVMMLHAIGDSDDPHAVVARVMDAVPDGSYLVISHPASDIEPEKVADLTARVNQLSYQQYTGRSREQVLRFFDGMELVEPGLVQVQQWRPGMESNATLSLWAGVGRT